MTTEVGCAHRIRSPSCGLVDFTFMSVKSFDVGWYVQKEVYFNIYPNRVNINIVKNYTSRLRFSSLLVYCWTVFDHPFVVLTSKETETSRISSGPFTTTRREKLTKEKNSDLDQHSGSDLMSPH